MWIADWQTIAALLCVACAVVVLLRRIGKWWNGGSTTGCHGCPASQSKPIVPLTDLKLSKTLSERGKSFR